MIVTHHDIKVELSDDWWEKAGMARFCPLSHAYMVDQSVCPNGTVFEVSILDIGPVRRKPSIGIFNDNEKLSACERVTSILRAFREGIRLPPVKVMKGNDSYPYRYKLVHGTHRLYCSIAAGYTHVPAVWGFDIKA